MGTSDAASITTDDSRQPVGLRSLFATEMWERFSYYGMRALLVLYLVNGLGKSPEDASFVYKWYTSLVYLTPLLGGWLADRVFGVRASIIAGAILMAAGHVLMAFPSSLSFYLALALLIAGNGFFKPNISTIVGKMYRDEDPRRGSAFTIFYMGINVGAFFSPLVCGTLRDHFGFHAGFAAAGVGMVIGLATFLWGQRHVLEAVRTAGQSLDVSQPRPPGMPKPPRSIHPVGRRGLAGVLSASFPAALALASVALLARYILSYANQDGPALDMLMPFAFAVIACVLAFLVTHLRDSARDRAVVILILFVFQVLFWMAFEQAGNALNLWAEFHTDRHLFGRTWPAEWWQSANPAFIVLFAPVVAALWSRLAKYGREPSIPAKMTWAMLLMGLSFLAMVWGAKLEGQHVTRVTVVNAPTDLGFERTYGGRVRYDKETGVLEVHGVLPHYVVTEIRERQKAHKPSVDPGPFTERLTELEERSQSARASGIWLLLSYLFATLGELCCSPVGIAMVTELAPRRFASLFMGVWLLSSSVAQYVGGTIGELWGKLDPAQYFSIFVLTSAVGFVALALLRAPVKHLMHDGG